MTVSSDQNTRMLTALVRLRGALQEARLPLDVAGVEAHRVELEQMIDQLEDYVIPRQMSVEAPLLVVVGGSTGAGKSTVEKLLARYYDVSGGAVLVDGHDVRELDLAAYRHQLGVVP